MNDYAFDVTVERPTEYSGPTDDAGQPTGSNDPKEVYVGRADIQISAEAVRRSSGAIDSDLDGVMFLPISFSDLSDVPEIGDTVVVNGGPNVPLGTEYRIDDLDRVSEAFGLRAE